MTVKNIDSFIYIYSRIWENNSKKNRLILQIMVANETNKERETNKIYHLVELYFGKRDEMYFPAIYTDKAISEIELQNKLKYAYTSFVENSTDVDNPFIFGKGIYYSIIRNSDFRIAKRSLFVIKWNPEIVTTKYILSYENENWLNLNIVSHNREISEADAFQIMSFNETNHLNTHSSFFKPNKTVEEFQNTCESIFSSKDVHSIYDISEYHFEFEQLLIENGFELYPHIQSALC